MRVESNECVCCDIPCNPNCSLKNVERIYCDECEFEIDGKPIEFEGKELCECCAKVKIIDLYFKEVERKRAYLERIADFESDESLLNELSQMGETELTLMLREENAEELLKAGKE